MSLRPYEDKVTLTPITPRPFELVANQRWTTSSLVAKGAQLYYDNEQIQELLSSLHDQADRPVKDLAPDKRRVFSQMQDVIRNHYGGELFEHLQQEIQRVFPGEPGEGGTVRDILLECANCSNSSCKNSVLVASWSPDYGYIFVTLLVGSNTGA